MKNILLLFLLLSTNVWATPTLVRSNQAEGNPQATITLPSNNVGNLLIITLETTGSIVSPSDTAGNTWTEIQEVDGVGWSYEAWYAKNCKASASTNTITLNDGGGYARVMAAEFSGVDTVSPLRNANSNTSTGTSLTTGVITTVSGDLVVGWFFNNGASVTSGGSYTPITSPSDALMEYKVTSTTSENPDATSSSNQWSAVGGAFIPSTTSTTHYNIIQ
jgi:hypothetical protein